MNTIDRTTRLFVESVRHAAPEAQVYVDRSFAKQGRSNYVYIYTRERLMPFKVRISDHAVGMRRALYGTESLFITHTSKPPSWAVWLSKQFPTASRVEITPDLFPN